MSVHRAVMAGSIEQLNAAIAAGDPVDALDREGRTALMYAALDKRLDLMERLLDNRANCNVRDKVGMTALHFAAQANCGAAVRLLVKSGADHQIRDGNGNTALFRAVFSYAGGENAVEDLLESGADADTENDHGVSARALALSIANYDTRKFFAT